MILLLDENGKTDRYSTALKILDVSQPCSHDKKNFIMFKTPQEVLMLSGYINDQDDTTEEISESCD